jgi:hypothetical protein
MSFPLLALLVCATSGGALVFARVTGRFFVAAAGAGAIVLYLHGAVYLHFTSDDAYISYRYAQHLADGAGLVWNRGIHVEGYANFLWVIVLAGADLAGGDMVTSGRWLGFASGAAAVGGAYLLTASLLEDGRAGRYAGLVAALALAASGPFALWSYAGLETPFFALLVVVAVLRHIREERHPGLPVSGVVWALVLLTRPDGAVLFAVSAAFKARDLVRALVASPPARREAISRFAIWLGGFAAIFVPYFAWRYATYGAIFPNAYYARSGGGVDAYERGARYLFAFSQQYGAWLILLALPALLGRGMRRASGAYVLALLTAWALYVVAIGGDSLLRFRFLAEALPLFYALICASGAAVLASLRIDGDRGPLIRAAAAALLGAGLVAFTLQSTPNEPHATAVAAERAAARDRSAIGVWLRSNAPPGTVIAVLSAGAIPYESELTTIDMLGVNDEHIAAGTLVTAPGAPYGEKSDAAYVLGRRPDAIILFDTLFAEPAGRKQYDALAFLGTPAAAQLVRLPALWAAYEPRSAEIGGRWLSMLVRKDSPLGAATAAP